MDIKTFELDLLNNDGDFCVKKYSQDPFIKKYFKYYRTISNKNSNTKFILGKLFNCGLGTEKNYEKAEFWYLKAAEQNNVSAQNNLGYLYEEMEEYMKAEFWYLQAAEQNNVDAQNNLGTFYEDGDDFQKAEVWYLKAAEQNDAIAQNNLGSLYECLKKDYEKALFWYEKASSDEKVVRVKKLINQNKKIEKEIHIINDDECHICKDTFLNNNKSILTIQCSHSFHYDCLKQWQMKCPLCFIDVQ